MKPLRICRVCGLQALTEKDLNNFTKDKRCPHGRQNMCNNCTNKYNAKWRKDYGYKEVHTQRRLELTKGFPKPLRCQFCGKLITKLEGQNKDSLVIHSLDGNHENWKPTNKVPVHNGCHTTFHGKNRPGRKLTLEARKRISQSLKGRNLGEKHWNWKGDKAKKASIIHRKYMERRRKKLV